jgi:predicted metal-dependent phosphoesterase TrpH
MRVCREFLSALVCVVIVGQAARALADEVIPADPPPRWWKGNLHTHTLWSDGDDFPEMAAEWYRAHGYHFLALSDHNVLAQGMRWMKEAKIVERGGEKVVKRYVERFGPSWVETRGEGDAREVRLKPLDEFRALVEERGRFLMLPAEEISDSAEGVPIHINASNIKESFTPLGGQTVRETIENNLRNVEEQARRAGREILAHLNHPNFGWAITAEDLAHVVIERHFEVYNGHPGVNQMGDQHRPSVERLWDIANTIRLAHLHAPPLFGIATDDTHHYHDRPHGARPGRGWLMVRATHLTPEHIVRAIKAGDCYASSGVALAEVRFDRERRTLAVDIDPAGDATYVTQFIGTLRGASTDGQPVALPTGEGKSSQPKRVSRAYSNEIGKVLKTVEGLSANYELTGQELYVRAVVTSSAPPRDPSFAGQRRQAWTQPVGWEVGTAGQ